jgi:hypothetical protein
MRVSRLSYVTGIAVTSIAVNAFDPFARESLELELLRKRSTNNPAIDIDPENKCNVSCTSFLSALHSCDIVVNGEIIDYTACLCKIAGFNDVTRTCYTCVEGLGNVTWTAELGLLLELCTATGMVNSTVFVGSSGLPNGRGAGTSGGQGQGQAEGEGQLPNGRGMGTNGGGANLTISRSVVVSGSATSSGSGSVSSTKNVAITSTSSVVPISSGMKTYSVVSGLLGLSILSMYFLL